MEIQSSIEVFVAINRKFWRGALKSPAQREKNTAEAPSASPLLLPPPIYLFHFSLFMDVTAFFVFAFGSS